MGEPISTVYDPDDHRATVFQLIKPFTGERSTRTLGQFLSISTKYYSVFFHIIWQITRILLQIIKKINTVEYWKDKLEHLIIIYKCCPTTIVPFRKEETATFINVFFKDYNHIIKPNYALKNVSANQNTKYNIFCPSSCTFNA